MVCVERLSRWLMVPCHSIIYMGFIISLPYQWLPGDLPDIIACSDSIELILFYYCMQHSVIVLHFIGTEYSVYVSVVIVMSSLCLLGGPQFHVCRRAESDPSGQCHFSQVQFWWVLCTMQVHMLFCYHTISFVIAIIIISRCLCHVRCFLLATIMHISSTGNKILLQLMTLKFPSERKAKICGITV